MRTFVFAAAVLVLSLATTLRADDPPPPPAPAIDPLPAGWKHTKDTPEMRQGEAADLKAFYDVVAEPKEDEFADWCKSQAKDLNRKSPLDGRRDTALTEKTIGIHHVMTYESSGNLFGSAAHVRYYFVEYPDKFVRLTCSCDDAHWEQSKAVLDDLVKNMK